MYKIEDYIEYYKDIPFKDIKINDLDLAIMAILAYLPIKPFTKEKKLKTIINEVNEEEIKSKNMISYAKDIINLLINSKRFNNLVICNYTSIINHQTQFEAMKIKLDNNTFFTYKGTDNSLIGWKENFRLSYMYPAYTQAMAKKYLVDNINIFDKNIYVVGHSKGGNLALSVGMEVNNKIFKKIRRVVNFDGPGLLPNEFNSDKYKRLKPKLINYIPDNSMIGILMNNDNYYYVKTDSLGYLSHYMFNWNIFGTFFLKCELSKASTKLHENNLISIKEVNKKELEKVIETFYAVIENNDIRKFTDIRKMNLSDIIKTINDLTDVSSETKKYFMEAMKLFINPKGKKKK